MSALQSSFWQTGASQHFEEAVEEYAQLILQHEGRPKTALPDCRREAEIQLWAARYWPETREQSARATSLSESSASRP